MKNSNIEWCDHTFNPWEGCTKVSPGCAHCYAETRNARWHGGTAPNWGKGAQRRRTSAKNWAEPLKWNREAGKLPPFSDELREWHRPRVFCASIADVFDPEVPLAWRNDLLRLIHDTPNLDWLLLTKRPEKVLSLLWDSYEDFKSASETMDDDGGDYSHEMADWLWDMLNNGNPWANVWWGTTVEDQQRADERIPEVMKIPAKIRFLSMEPLLRNVWLKWNDLATKAWNTTERIHWVICGGESGPGARPMHPDWAREIRRQCAASQVPFFFKQWGEWVAVLDPEAAIERGVPRNIIKFFPELKMHFARVGKKVAGRELDGVEHNAFPEVLP